MERSVMNVVGVICMCITCVWARCVGCRHHGSSRQVQAVGQLSRRHAVLSAFLRPSH